MKYTITKTMLSLVFALAMTAMIVFSQNKGLTQDAAASFSIFSAPQNMGATLNTADTEQNAVIAPNGLSFYFSSNRLGGQGGNDIWVSQRPTLTSAWGAPQNLGATVNSSSGDAAMSFSRDGRTMFLQSQRPGGMGGNDLYVSTRTDTNNDFGWTAPVNLGPVINSTLTDIGANYFEDPATGAGSLIFCSDRDGTPGMGFDVYQSTRNADGTFNPPTPINELNSVGAELRTTIRRDGLEIFISASRPGGMAPGLFDIWVSTRASTTSLWNPPVLVPGLNTSEDDSQPALSPDGSILYFQSNRAGGFGGLDLYSTTRVSVNRSSTADFDGDGRTDLSVFRPSDGTWYVMESGTNTFRAHQFGVNGDKIVSGDYDGDGRTDFAVFRPSTGVWWISKSSDNSVSTTNWGLATDKPVPGDYDGDGRTDIAVYRDGTWYIVQSSNGSITYQQFGLSGDIPIMAASF